MKKLMKLLLTLLAIVAVSTLSSCKKTAQDMIVGVWEVVSNSSSNPTRKGDLWEFKTGTVIRYVRCMIDNSLHVGTYAIDGPSITVELMDCPQLLGTITYIDNKVMTLDIPSGTIEFKKSNKTLPNVNGGTTYNISVSANPSNGGTTTGGGAFQYGESCTVRALANPNYTFDNWTENGNVTSSLQNYSFTVTSTRSLVANFKYNGGGTGQYYQVNVSATAGGNATGGGSFLEGVSCTVTATPNTNYTFANWTENGSIVSTFQNYSFEVTGNRNLVANFNYNGGGNAIDYTKIILNELNGNDKFIEIYNSGTEAINLNGVYIEKDGAQNWIADNTVIIESDGYLLLYSEDVQADHFGYPENMFFHSSLSAKKNVRIQLFTPAGVSIDDFNMINIDLNGETYGYASNQAPASYSRNTDGNWYYADATPGRANVNGSNLVLGLEGGYNPGPSFFSISVSSNPNSGGLVIGGGAYQEGQSCTVSATPKAGFAFVNWTENGIQVSTSANYTFTATGNRTLVANFILYNNYSNIILNELNGAGKFIEIYNKGDMDLSLEGMYIMKDDYVAGAIWTAEATVVAPAHGYVLLYSVDVTPDHPDWPEHLFLQSGMSSKKTCRYTLFLSDGTVCDEFIRGTTGEWGLTISNVSPLSFARTPDGGDWKLADPTPGEANPTTGDDIPQE